MSTKRSSDNTGSAKVAASVVLYNSDNKTIENVRSYLHQVDKLYLIDNSEKKDALLVDALSKLPNTLYIDNGGNRGIAHALNAAASLAIKDDYAYLLTMDDDTSLPVDAVAKMLSFAESQGDIVGIVAGQSNTRHLSNTISYVPFTITSGNLLNLRAYQQCGPFMEELFIDYVDHEFCFRLRKEGYSIVEMNGIHLIHSLGHPKDLTLFTIKLPVRWTSHSPTRIYYKIRNGIYVLRKHNYLSNSIKWFFIKDMMRDGVKLIFLEDQKMLRIKLVAKAVQDGIQNRLGKLSAFNT